MGQYNVLGGMERREFSTPHLLGEMARVKTTISKRKRKKRLAREKLKGGVKTEGEARREPTVFHCQRCTKTYFDMTTLKVHYQLCHPLHMTDLDKQLDSSTATRRRYRGCCDECDPEKRLPPVAIFYCPVSGCSHSSTKVLNMEFHVLTTHYGYKYWCLQCPDFGNTVRTRLKTHYLACHPKYVHEVNGMIMTARGDRSVMASPEPSTHLTRNRTSGENDGSSPSVMTRSRYRAYVHGLGNGSEEERSSSSVRTRSGYRKAVDELHKEESDSEEGCESLSVMTRARYKRYVARNISTRRRTQENNTDSEESSDDEDDTKNGDYGFKNEKDDVNVRSVHSNNNARQQMSPVLSSCENLVVPESPCSSQSSLSSLAEEDFEIHEEPRRRAPDVPANSDDPFFASLDSTASLQEKAQLCYENFYPQFPILDPTLLNGANTPASALRSVAAIGELSCGDLTAAHDLWNAGMSILQQFLANPDNFGFKWVQACIPLFELMGLFAFSVTEKKYQLFNKAMIRCIEDESKLAEGDEGKETLVRSILGHYILEQLKRIFNHGLPSICFQNLTVRLPHYETEYIIFNNDTLSTLMDQLCFVPVDLLECHLTGLALLLAIFETQQREQDSQKSMTRLTNLCTSVSCSPYYFPQHMILFWSLVHLLRIEVMFNFCRSQPIGLFSSDPIKVLKVDLIQWRGIIQSLPPNQRIDSFVQNSETLYWALHTLSTYTRDTKELPLVRLSIYRIIHICWLLLVHLESNPTVQSIWFNIAENLSLSPSDTPSQQLASFATTQFQSPGAWGIGQKLPPLS